MVKVYAVSLVIGFVGLLLVIMGGVLAMNVGHPERDPGERIGLVGRSIIGALAGFGMGGLSAEFSPLDFTWQVSVLIALGAAGLSILWVRYAVARSEPE